MKGIVGFISSELDPGEDVKAKGDKDQGRIAYVVLLRMDFPAVFQILWSSIIRSGRSASAIDQRINYEDIFSAATFVKKEMQRAVSTLMLWKVETAQTKKQNLSLFKIVESIATGCEAWCGSLL